MEETIRGETGKHRAVWSRTARPYVTAQFVERMPDGVVKYNITLTDAVHNVDVDLRVCLHDGEPFQCENMATREHTDKHEVVARPVAVEFLAPMLLDVNINN